MKKFFYINSKNITLTLTPGRKSGTLHWGVRADTGTHFGEGDVTHLVKEVADVTGISPIHWFNEIEPMVKALLSKMLRTAAPGYFNLLKYYKLNETVEVEGFSVPDFRVWPYLKESEVPGMANLCLLWVNYLGTKAEIETESKVELRNWKTYGDCERRVLWYRCYSGNVETAPESDFLPLEAVFAYPHATPLKQRLEEAVVFLKNNPSKGKQHNAVNCMKLLISAAFTRTSESHGLTDGPLVHRPVVVFPYPEFGYTGSEKDFFSKRKNNPNVSFIMGWSFGVLILNKLRNRLIDLQDHKALVSVFENDPAYFRSLVDQWSCKEFESLLRESKMETVMNLYTNSDKRLERQGYNSYGRMEITSDLEEIWFPKLNRVRPEVLSKIGGRILSIPTDFWLGRNGSRIKGTFNGILIVDKESMRCTLTDFSDMRGAEVSGKDIVNSLTADEFKALMDYKFKTNENYAISIKPLDFDRFSPSTVKTVIHFDHDWTSSPYASKDGYPWTKSTQSFMGNPTLEFNLAEIYFRDEAYAILEQSGKAFARTHFHKGKTVLTAIERFRKTVINK